MCVADRGRSRAEHQAHHGGGEQAHCGVRLRVRSQQPPEQRHGCAQGEHHVSPWGTVRSSSLTERGGLSQVLLSSPPVGVASLGERLGPIWGEAEKEAVDSGRVLRPVGFRRRAVGVVPQWPRAQGLWQPVLTE